MITSVAIHGVRGIREGNLEDLTPLVVLVGPNGSGKSTILDALYVGASLDPRRAPQELAERRDQQNVGGRWFLWRADLSGAATILVSTSAETSRICELKSLGGNDIQCTWHPVEKAVVGRDDRLPATKRHASRPEALEGVAEIRLVGPRTIQSDPPLHQLYTRAVEQGRRSEALALIADVVPFVENLEILTEGNTPIVHLVFHDHSVPVALAGDGVCSLVRIALELASRRHGVVLLEEPEVHQHPGAIRQTVRAILAAVRREIQVVLSTHSLELIDYILAESGAEDLDRLSLYRLQLHDGMLATYRMPGSEVALARSQIEEDLR